MNGSLNELLLRYLEIERQSRNLASEPINNPFGRSTGRIPPPPVFNFGDTNRAPSQSPINNTPFNFSWPNNTTNTTGSTNTNATSRTQPSLRSLNSFRPRDAPISSFTRRRTRRAPRIRATTNVTTTTIPRDVFQIL